jgi:hypothetical protein
MFVFGDFFIFFKLAAWRRGEQVTRCDYVFFAP